MISLLHKITQIKSLKVSLMVEAVIECDTDIDTYCLGRNCVVLEHTNSTADIHSHDKSNIPQVGIPIVTGATAYDNLVTGLTYILVFSESLYYGNKLDHSLMNPNQL